MLSKEKILGWVIGAIGVYLTHLGMMMMNNGKDPRFWKD